MDIYLIPFARKVKHVNTYLNAYYLYTLITVTLLLHTTSPGKLFRLIKKVYAAQKM